MLQKVYFYARHSILVQDILVMSVWKGKLLDSLPGSDFVVLPVLDIWKAEKQSGNFLEEVTR